jgi:hypothetical protein
MSLMSSLPALTADHASRVGWALLSRLSDAQILLPAILLAASAGQRRPAWFTAGGGALPALPIGLSRLRLGVHSSADATIGGTLGLLVAGLALRTLWRDAGFGGAVPVWLPATMLAWLLITPSMAPPSLAHDWVTRLSLAVSGRPTPYTSAEMMRTWTVQRAGAAAPR